MRRLSTTLLLASVAIGHHAHAQNADTAPPNETLQVTATRVPTDVDDVSAGVTVIDRATIEQRGYTTLVDALSAVPGATIVQSGGPGGNASLFLRGANSNQVQVLIDGVPINDASGPGEAYNFGVETLADVERIEVVRGPMSAVYGSGAIGGVVNIITRRGTGGVQADLTLAAGAPRALLGQADVRGKSGAFDYNLSAESRSDRGFDATPERESVYTGERDGFRTSVGGLDVGYTPLDGTRLFVDVRGRTTVFGYDDVNYPAFDDPDETGRDNDLYGRTGITSQLFGGAWQTSLTASRDQEYRRYVNLLDVDDPNQAAEDSRYVGLRSDIQWNNIVRVPDVWRITATSLTAGYEHIDEQAQERLNSIDDGFPYLASVDAADRRNSGYLGLQGAVAEHLAFNGNIREEAVSGVSNAFTWRIGGSYALPVLASHLKASYGTAFLAPSLFDRYGVDSDGYVGNPLLRPERSHGYEVGWSANLDGSAAVLDVTWFHTAVRDLIETPFFPVYTSVNIAAARLQGVETELHLHPAPWIDADLVYTYTDARDRQSGQQLLRRPYDTGALTLTVRPLPAVSITPQVTFASGDLDALVDNQGFFTNDGRNPGGAIFNLNATWQVDRRVSLFAWGRNLANSGYEAASGYAMPGPSVLAGIRLSYR